MGIVSGFFGALRRAIARSERDQIALKFDSIEMRMDSIEISQAEMKSEIKAIHEVWLANSELLEGKLNLSRVNQELIKDMIDTRFCYVDRSVEDIKKLIDRLS